MPSARLAASAGSILALSVGLVALPATPVAASPLALAPAFADEVARAGSHLGRAETNLQIVDSAIGRRTSPPRGAAAKLQAQRLQQVLGDLEAARTLLGKAAADAPGAAEARARHAAAVATYERLRTILTGDSGDSGTGGGDTGGADGTQRLDYRQEEALKGAQFNLRAVEATAKALAAELETYRAAPDRLAISHRQVETTLATLAEARRKAGFVADALEPLPAEGKGVPSTRRRLVNARATLDAVAAFTEPLAGELRRLVDPARYPNLRADLERLGQLSRPYANEMVWQTDRAAAAEAVRQLTPVQDEVLRIGEAYARLVQQRTDEGVRIEAAGRGLIRNVQRFVEEAKAQRAALPGEIRELLARTEALAEEAVREQKPLWFTGGIVQDMGFVDERLALLGALDPDLAKSVAEEVAAVRKRNDERAKALRSLIIRENRPVKDAYAGSDRDAVIRIARSGWSVQQKDARVLAVRIPSETWRRETKLVWSAGAWTLVDRSTLQVRLYVADHQDGTLAIDRPVNVIMDHQAGDRMIGVPVWGFKDALTPSFYLQRSVLKGG